MALKDVLVKFPRTPHLDDLGAASRDDLVLPHSDALGFLVAGVVLEEKVDGANLGISFESEDGPPRCQKRGHWVTSKSEQQFAKLESWLASHEEALRRALGTRYILYGEWVAARHSVSYDALPDWFLAYDVYDREAIKFLSSRRRDLLLRGTGIRSVPSVVPYPGRAFTGPDALQQIRQMVMELRTALCVPGSDQWAEGLYLRREDGDWLVARAKLVHSAFRQAIEGDEGSGGGTHWSKRITQWNRVRPDLWEPAGDDDDDAEGPAEQPAAAEALEVERLGVETLLDGREPKLGGGDPNEGAAGGRDVMLPGAMIPASGLAAVTGTGAAAPVAVQGAMGAAEPAEPSHDLDAGAGTQGLRAPSRAPPHRGHGVASRGSLPRPSPKEARVELSCGGLYVSLAGSLLDRVATCLLDKSRDVIRPGHVANRVARDGPLYHITLVTPPEMTKLEEAFGIEADCVLSRVLDEIDASGGAWVPLGLGRGAQSALVPGGASETFFMVVAWPTGRAARDALGLGQNQHFHATLGFNPSDVFDIPKDLTSLVGGRLDEQLVEQLVAEAEVAGAWCPRFQRAAVLVTEALTDLQPSSEAGSGSTPAGARRGLTPGVIECVQALTRLALQWTSPSVPTAPNPAQRTPSHQKQQAEDGYSRRLVAACACVAMARLAGRCGEMEEAYEHAMQAEAQLRSQGAPGVAAVAEAGSGERATAEELEVRAAAACVAGKALSQLERYSEAAAELERAADLLERAGLPDITSATAATDVMNLMLRAVRPTMSVSELREAAAKCNRMAARWSARSTSKVEAPDAASHSQTAAAGVGAGNASGAGDRTEPKPVGAAACSRSERGPSDVDPDAPSLGASAGPAAHSLSLGAHAEAAAAVASLWPSVDTGLAPSPLNPRERAIVRGVVTGSGGGVPIDVTLMRNTSWVVPGVLAGSSTPKNPEQIMALATLGIGLVVTLTEEEPLPPQWFTPATRPPPEVPSAPVRNLFVPVPNYEPPSVQQMDDILTQIEEHFALAMRAMKGHPAGNAAGDGQRRISQHQHPHPHPPLPLPGVLVHCGGGKGRAGTVLACFLCKHGQALPVSDDPSAQKGADPGAPLHPPPAMSADAAVRLVRDMRPGSIETEQQKRFVSRYCDELWRRCDRAAAGEVVAEAQAQAQAQSSGAGAAGTSQARAVSPSGAANVSANTAAGASAGPRAVSSTDAAQAPQQQQQQPQEREAHPRHHQEPADGQAGPSRQPQPQPHQSRRPAQNRAGRPAAHLPRLVFLVGLPGSGKSTFAKALEASGSWTRICQDECGSRGAAEAAFCAAVLRGTAKPHAVLDRCCPDIADRREWLDLGLFGKRDKGIVAVFFDVPAAECKARVAARVDHPTIQQGRGGRIVDSFAARLQPPTIAEGFERVHTVRSYDDAEALLSAWGAGGLMRVEPPAAGQDGPDDEKELDEGWASEDTTR